MPDHEESKDKVKSDDSDDWIVWWLFYDYSKSIYRP